MRLKQKIRRILRSVGYDIVPFTPRHHSLARRKKILESSKTDLVLDIGAHFGGYAQELRSIGYKGRIVSFEPLSAIYEELVRNSATDSEWETVNCALGDTNGTTQINIAGNSYSSSILDMLPSHLASAPDSRYVGKEKIKIRTLDSIWPDIYSREAAVWMKVDTQGFEKRVLEGARSSLDFINVLQIEMSLIPLYQDDLLFEDIHELLGHIGFRLVSIEQGFSDEKTGHTLQVDCIYRRM